MLNNNFEGIAKCTGPKGQPVTFTWMVKTDDRPRPWTIRKTNVSYMRIDMDGVTTLLYQGRWSIKPFWFTQKLTWKLYRFLVNFYECQDF